MSRQLLTKSERSMPEILDSREVCLGGDYKGVKVASDEESGAIGFAFGGNGAELVLSRAAEPCQTIATQT